MSDDPNDVPVSELVEAVETAEADVKKADDDFDAAKEAQREARTRLIGAKEALAKRLGFTVPSEAPASKSTRTRSTPKTVTPEQVLSIVEQEKDTVFRQHKGARIPHIAETLGSNRANVEEALSILQGADKVKFTGKGPTKRWIPA